MIINSARKRTRPASSPEKEQWLSVYGPLCISTKTVWVTQVQAPQPSPAAYRLRIDDVGKGFKSN